MSYGANFTSIGLNPWAYSMFPGVAGSNVTYPSDSASIWNDTNLFKFDSDANRLLNGSTALCQQMIPAMNSWYAQVAQVFQKIMQNIQGGNTNINIGGNNGVNPTVNKNIDPATGKLKESKIIAELQKMGAGESTKDRMNKEITYKDKDGNEHKSSLVSRLISMVKDYQENPDETSVSKEDYEKIWNIATTYAKTGELSTDDYKTLLEIAKKAETKVADNNDDSDDEKIDKEDKEKEKEEKTKSKAREFAEYQDAKKNGESGAVFRQGVSAAVDGYKNGLIGWGTDYEQLDAGQAALNPDNVVEVWDQYYKEVGINHGENLIESIYDDFDDWTDSWYGITGGASRFTAVADALVERAQTFIEKYGEQENFTNENITRFQDKFNGINESNYDSKKQEISDMFKNFVNEIKAAEAKLAKAGKAED